MTIVRRRHPLEGRRLRVLGGQRRQGALRLLVVLPDGGRMLVPASWTDLTDEADGSEPGTIATLADLRAMARVVAGLVERGENADVATGDDGVGR